MNQPRKIHRQSVFGGKRKHFDESKKRLHETVLFGIVHELFETVGFCNFP
jgi:hypothetical protein